MAAISIALGLLSIVAAASADGHVPPEGSKFSYCHGKAHYKISVYGMWNESGGQSHEFPNNAMFSPFTSASHNFDYTMWRPMRMASEGVQQVAETGANTKLVEELETYKYPGGNVYDIKTGSGPVPPSGHYTTEIYTTTEYHFVSLISMIFPSPDWFIGVYNLDLCISDTARWARRRTLNLYAWDAGTDSGRNFSANDWPTDPKEYITLIVREDDPYSSFQIPDDHSDPMYKYVPKFATVMFERLDEDEEKPKCKALGTQSYHVRFQGDWTAENHPRDFPNNAHFSPLVAAGHSAEYHMWVPGMKSSPGVQTVAETGNATILQGELNAAHGIEDHMTAAGPVRSNATMQTYVDVDMYHSYISAISMIFPSPDWFVGVSSIDLCDGYFWKDGPIIFRLLPWDAGTDDGLTFASDDAVTDPQADITLITTDTMGAFYNRARQHIAPLGTITLERKKDPDVDYRNAFQTWKNAMNDFQEQFEQWKNDECPSS